MAKKALGKKGNCEKIRSGLKGKRKKKTENEGGGVTSHQRGGWVERNRPPGWEED